MHDDITDEDSYAVALRRAQEREAIRARNDAWFEFAVLQPYREAGSPYGNGPAEAIQWFREQFKKKQSGA